MVDERRQAKLVHHPIGLDAFRGPAFVEHKRLLEPDALRALRRVYGPVRPRGLPKPGPRDPVRPRTIPVLPVPRAVEIPLLLTRTRQL